MGAQPIYEILGSIFNTPFEEVLARAGVRESDIKNIKDREKITPYWLIDIIYDILGFLDIYDFETLVYSKDTNALTVVGFGEEHARRNTIHVTPPLEIVDVYGNNRIVVFKDSDNRLVYYDRLKNALSREAILEDTRRKEIEHIVKLLSVVAEDVNIPFMLEWSFISNKWLVMEITTKSDYFAFMSGKRHKIKLVKAEITPQMIGGYERLVFTGKKLLPVIRVKVKRWKRRRSLPYVLFLWMYDGEPELLREARNKIITSTLQQAHKLVHA